jgi:hypothetical protein
MSTEREMWDIQRASEWFGWPPRYTREYLQALHEKHGELLFRASTAPNAKLWVDSARLRRLRPSCDGPATKAEVAILIKRAEEAEAKADRALREVAEFRRKANAWFRKSFRE